MSVVLSIYSESAYKEYVLPAVRNEETSLVVDRNVFRLKKDVELHLENVDGKWFIKDAASARIESGSGLAATKELRDGENYLITTPNGDELSVIVAEKDTSFVCYKKYSLHGLSEVTVGSDAENMIEYFYLS